MIIVKIKDNGINMVGHADRKDQTGIDRVCAAVSALTCNLITVSYTHLTLPTILLV